MDSTPVGVENTGRNVWAISKQASAPDDDALTIFTLLSGPGIPGVVAPQGKGEAR